MYEFVVGKKNPKTIIIDEEDLPKIQKYKWHVTSGYASASLHNGGNRKSIRLHRLVMGVAFTGNGLEVDHINRNRLDNRKCNLRFATPSQNLANVKRTKSKTGYPGVRKQNGKWQAYLGHNNKRIAIGNYATLKEAVKARDDFGKSIHGEFFLCSLPDCDIVPKDITRQKTSRYPAVSLNRRTGKWVGCVYIGKQRQRFSTSYLDSEEEAAMCVREILEQHCPSRLDTEKYKILPKRPTT